MTIAPLRFTITKTNCRYMNIKYAVSVNYPLREPIILITITIYNVYYTYYKNVLFLIFHPSLICCENITKLPILIILEFYSQSTPQDLINHHDRSSQNLSSTPKDQK